MEAITTYLIEYGYWILFLWVLLDQLALPVPALPMVLVAGGLAGEGHLSLLLCTIIVLAGCLPVNFLWYYLGRYHGNKVLTFMCTVSLDPETCVDSTTSSFQRHITTSLLFAKFIPGLQTLAPPLSGLMGMSVGRYTILSSASSLIYALVFLLPGYLASDLLAEILRVVLEYGSLAAGIVLTAALIWLARKIANRLLFVRRLKRQRMEPEDLLQHLTKGPAVQICDVRQHLEFNAFPKTLPGAIRLPLDGFDERVEALNQERLQVLICT